MRLIETKTLRLVSKRDNEIPPYAILSHTWGSDADEVTLQEYEAYMKAHDGSDTRIEGCNIESKPGFVKIKAAAQKAMEFSGREFLWVDTCCIDKTSSAELSEAINSMYRWYRNAKTCLVYLSDVSMPRYAHTDTREAWDVARRSRWFRRGWTLQELIAPSEVEFFDSQWRLFANKRYSRYDLGQITGIDAGVLDHSTAISELSVASRMRWVAERETTRTEDLAYCLLGIFEVNMPLLYGEGERAFIRLQEEILKKSNDYSIFAWEDSLATRAPFTGLLASSPRHFSATGNEALARQSWLSSLPSTNTNVGLHVHFELAPSDSESEPVVYALLKPAAESGGHQSQQVAVILAPVGGEQFVRVNSHQLVYLPSERSQLADSTTAVERQRRRRYVYVQQEPQPPIPTIKLAADWELLGHGFLEAYPRHVWDNRTRAMRPLKIYDAGVIGAFRFKCPAETKTTNAKFQKAQLSVPVVDIFIQVRFRGTTSASMSFDCFQRFPFYSDSMHQSWTSAISSLQDQASWDENTSATYHHYAKLEHAEWYGSKYLRLSFEERVELGVTFREGNSDSRKLPRSAEVTQRPSDEDEQ